MEHQNTFFIYDKNEVRKGECSPEEGILFFYPNSITEQEQHSLVGQLIGMLSFSEGVLNSGLKSLKLKNEKFVIKSLGNIIMVFGGVLSDPDNLLLEILDYLYGIFEFFHNSFAAVRQDEKSSIDLKKRMFEIWNCYLPIVNHYEGDLLSYFDSIQYTEMEKAGLHVYLKALELLEACQRRPESLCGCIFSSEKVIASQAHPNILRYLSVLKPGQLHLPSSQIEVDGNLPYGVRILKVFVNKESYEEIRNVSKFTPYSLLVNSDNLCLNSVEKVTEATEGKMNHESKDFTRSFKAFNLKNQKHQALQTKEVSLSDDDGNDLAPYGDRYDLHHLNFVHDSIQRANKDPLGGACLDGEDTIGSSYDSDVDSIWDRKYGGNLEDLRESVRKFNMLYENRPGPRNSQEMLLAVPESDSDCFLESSVNMICDQDAIISPQTKQVNKRSSSYICSAVDEVSFSKSTPLNTASNTVRGIQDASTEGDNDCNALDGQQQNMHRSSDSLDRDKNEESESESTYRSSKELSKCHKMCNQRGVISSSHLTVATSKTSIGESAIDDECHSNKEMDFVLLEDHDESPTLYQFKPDESVLQSSIVEDACELETDTKAVSNKIIPVLVRENGLEQQHVTSKESENTQHNMKMLHLYVQSHSNSMIVIFLDPEKNHDAHMLRSMYEIIVPRLGDLEASMQNSTSTLPKSNEFDDYVYFMYDNDEKKYRGGCSLISQEDYTFVSAIKNIHSQFESSRTMVDATFRDCRQAVYGKRILHQEIYCQPRGSYKSIQGAPTPYDLSCVIDRRINAKLKKDNTGIIL